MATVRYIVNSALRKIGRLGAGREPRVADQTDVLAALEGVYSSWLSAGTFGRLNDIVPTGSSYVARGGERIWRQDADILTVTLPELVSAEVVADYGTPRQGYYGTKVTIETVGDETTVTVEPGQPIGYVLPPRDGAAVVISDSIGGQTRSWLYDGHCKKWQRLEQLQLDEEAPRSDADPEGLSANLSLEIADMFGAEVGQTTQRQAARYLTAMTQRYGMRREATTGIFM